uniref:Uncharacterized protein n=1 Tax=Nelumbo nucifera TaxID=4432 RepID=A0A822Y2V8_NELNU|nr:TPA_asm: hypothetical protein HUJ06_028060 [Nelumbo nucifera]
MYVVTIWPELKLEKMKVPGDFLEVVEIELELVQKVLAGPYFEEEVKTKLKEHEGNLREEVE